MEPDVVRIDFEQVPKERRGDPRFVGIRARINATYSDPNLIQQIAMHEAAHAIFLEEADTVGIKFFGPKIFYDSTKENPFDYQNASTKGSGRGGKQSFDAAWILKGAKACFAGGVAVRELMGVSDGGDATDTGLFDAFCDTLLASKLVRNIDRAGLAKLAQDELLTDLNVADTRVKIWNKVGDVIPQICAT